MFLLSILFNTSGVEEEEEEAGLHMKSAGCGVELAMCG
jgi:hypothetical protein